MESADIKLYLDDTKGIWPELTNRKIILDAEDVTFRPVSPELLYYLEPGRLEIARTDHRPGEECGGVHISLRIDLPDGSIALVVMPREVFRQAARKILNKSWGEYKSSVERI